MASARGRLTARQAELLNRAAAGGRIETGSVGMDSYIRGPDPQAFDAIHQGTLSAVVNRKYIRPLPRVEQQPWYATFWELTDAGRAALAAHRDDRAEDGGGQ